MLMWGLALRHGWGCAKNERQGFAWLRRAAESAVDDLERARQGMDTTAIRSELVLAIYEVGQCFFQGWGVKKDQKMAVVRPVPSVCLSVCPSVRAGGSFTSFDAHACVQSYFQVAAKLGDADAQQELAFCLANGKGCKKDRKEAAKWYRDAVRCFSLLAPRSRAFSPRTCRSPRARATSGWRGYTRKSSSSGGGGGGGGRIRILHVCLPPLSGL